MAKKKKAKKAVSKSDRRSKKAFKITAHIKQTAVQTIRALRTG